MSDVKKHERKMNEMFESPIHHKTKKLSGDDVLILKAVSSYLNGNSEKSVDMLIEAVNRNAKCINTLEVNWLGLCWLI